MAFVHLAGVTTPGAPDEVIDWFTTFEAWIVSLGWTVEAGGGTQDITFRSLSEAGGLTKLYLRVWRDLVNVNHVYFRVQDDLAGTHFTTPVADPYVDSGGVQFAYWMSGDMDAIIVCFKLGAGYRHIYAGMVIPFALTVPDETYRMIVSANVVAGTILRNHDGAWDVDANISVSADMVDNRVDLFDGSFSLPGTYFGSGANIAGQLSHISGRIQGPAINAEDTIATGRPGATTSWVVLADHSGKRFALRTGGVLPTGIPDGTFASASGNAVNFAGLYGGLAGILLALGWTDLGDPGVDDDGRLFYSQGESGQENIYVLFSRIIATTRFRVHVQDDAVGTHRATHEEILDPAIFPVNYWISADKDCVVLVVQQALGYTRWSGGMVAPFPGGLVAPYPGPSLSEYSMVCSCQGNISKSTAPKVLRAHDGTWNAGILIRSDGSPSDNSNPNAFDGTTYLVWPIVASRTAVGNAPIGQTKYFFYSSGGGIANLDTITVGAKVYTVFFDNVAPIPRVLVLRTT